MIRPPKWVYAIVFIFLTITIFNDCVKEASPLYDLFPLKAGNEYYYKYDYKYDHILAGYQYIGNQEWTIISDSLKNGFIEYLVEIKFNGIYIIWSDLSPDIFTDTLNIQDSVRYMKIIENQSSYELNLHDIASSGQIFPDLSFNRYQHVKDTIIRMCDNDLDPCKTYSFRADSGLTEYYYMEGLMAYRKRESLILDSLKIK